MAKKAAVRRRKAMSCTLSVWGKPRKDFVRMGGIHIRKV
jgi:hypothetical protein